MRNASGQVKMSGSEKIKANMILETKSLVNTYDNSSKKQRVNRKFDVLVVQNGIVGVQNNGKERQKSVLHVQMFFVFC